MNRTKSICGIDCTQCPFLSNCKGCVETDGRPFGEPCLVAACCRKGENALKELKAALLEEVHALNIPELMAVTELHALRGAFVNLEYHLPSGQSAKLLHDDRIYLGNQVHCTDTDRCYGIAADVTCLVVSEYGANGTDASLVLFKRLCLANTKNR